MGFYASERNDVTALLIGVSTLAVVGLGWFGHKALRRIEAWGRNMNEIDGIFQGSAMEDGGWSSRPVSERKPRGISLVPTIHHHA
jgi:hypothetical protein